MTCSARKSGFQRPLTSNKKQQYGILLERVVRHAHLDIATDHPTLAQKVDFLTRPAAYPHAASDVSRRESHMSWIFLAGNRAYKLKKPVRFPYLDFSTIDRREAACRAELRLNRRLAPDVYLGVEPLVATDHGLTIGGEGTPVDWLVVMRRLDESQTLEHAIQARTVEPWQIDRLAATLIEFYRHAHRIFLPEIVQLSEWRLSLSYNRRILLDPKLGMPCGLVRYVDHVQERFLERRQRLLTSRIRSRKIVDGHGDLRPEHIWLGDPVRIIDCLEFNPRLRAVDPFDEIAFLSLECARLGSVRTGAYLKRRVSRGLRDGLSDELFLFYRCHRATLRARLAIAHLLEPNPRTPEKWPRQARTYLRLAAADARCLETLLKKRRGRPRADRHEFV
jgi:aminoglycoside phosphotransferase family enzyme